MLQRAFFSQMSTTAKQFEKIWCLKTVCKQAMNESEVKLKQCLNINTSTASCLYGNVK